MSTRALVFLALLVAGCATGRGERSALQASPPVARPAVDSRVPPLFQRAPWSIAKDPAGGLVLIQGQLGLRFGPWAGELERAKIRIFDEASNDVGFFYEGAFPHVPPKCVYGLTVYVYPASAPLDRHLAAVRAEIMRANPAARATNRIINLDQEHGGTGVHAGYLNDVNGLESFEAVSIFERAGWFIKYRTTMGPAGNPACERRLRAAVADMHSSEARAPM